MPIGTATAIGLGATVGGQLGSAAIGASAAGKAADAQTAAAEQQRADVAPFRETGVGVQGQLQEGMAPGGGLIAPFEGEFQAPTVTDDPGYQFRLEQGNQAIERSAAARGGITTGGTVKAIDQYSQGLASQEYGNAYARALTEYGLGRENFYQNQQNEYDRLTGVTGIGLQATGMGNQATAQAGAAQAAGAVGAGNAWGGAVGNIGNIAGNYLSLSDLYGGRGTRTPESYPDTPESYYDAPVGTRRV